VTTCTWSFRRHAGRVMAVALSAALTSGLVISSTRASADQMGNLQAQASSLAARITSLGLQEDALSERFDQAQYQLQTLQTQVASAQSKLAAAQASAQSARNALKADAVQAYVDGGNNPLNGGNAIQGATNSLLRAEYVNTLATNESDAIDQYRLASLQEEAAAKQLKQRVNAAQSQLTLLNSDRRAVASASAQLTADETQVDTQITQLKAQQLAEERAAQAAAAAAVRAAAEQRAQQLAAAIQSLQGGASTVSVNYTPPPPGSGASGAVRAAESRVGDWYQWGAAGPNTFDCSGLVMWAYEQVGISLPHYSGAQYSDTTHIPMSDLQPGDLVFFSNPGEHVAMYVGGGDIVEAPHTGTQVHIVPMYSGFTLAGRVQ
jgi:peptidoglycan DL-endopeptidase CwlO